MRGRVSEAVDPHTPGNADRCEKNVFAGRATRIVMKAKGRAKTVGTSEGLNLGNVGSRAVPPPRVFCKKSVDLLDSKGLDFLESAKESAIV